MPEESDEYPPLPGSGQRPRARHAASAYRAADEQPPEYDGPEELPEMMEPPDELPALAMPKNAPLHLQMVLSTVHDQAQQQLLIDCYNEMGPGLQQELFGHAAAYFSAILDHQLGRPDQTADELLSIAGQLRSTSEEWGTALVHFEKVLEIIGATGGGSQPTAAGQTMPDFKGHFEQQEIMRQIVSKEVDRAVAAAHAVNARSLKIACLCCFLAGIIAAALFVHWF